MFRPRSVWLASLLATLWLVAPLDAGAQPITQLKSTAVTGTIAANGESVTLPNTAGLAGVTLQTLDTYSGTLELQCATDAAQLSFDADDEVMLTLMGSTTTATDVTDTVGIYQGNISGCTAVKVIATAGFAASDTAVRIVAITPGGGSSGGGGSTFNGVLLDAASGDAVTDTANDAIRVNVVAGAGSGGTAAADESAFTLATTNLTPMGCIEATDTAAAGSVMAVRCGSNRVLDTDVISLPALATGSNVIGAVTQSGTWNIGTITPGVAGVNLGKLEDNPALTGEVGVSFLAMREDTPTATAGASGDHTYVKANANGVLWTVPINFATAAALSDNFANPTTTSVGGMTMFWDGATWDRWTGAITCSNCSGSGVSHVDNAAFTAGTTPMVPIGGFFDDTGSATATENSAAVARITANKAIHVNLRTAAGVELTPATDATFGTSTYTEATTTGPPVGAVRNDTPDALVGTTNEVSPLGVNAAGALWTSTIDPCTSLAKIYIPISITTGTQLFTGTASNRTYVCQLSLVSATTQNIALVSGTGTVCATSLGPMMGGTTAATGFNFVANGGIVIGGGAATVAKSDTDADNICILMSSTGQLSGVLSYVVAPN